MLGVGVVAKLKLSAVPFFFQGDRMGITMKIVALASLRLEP